MARYSLNEVNLIGNLGRDPELRYTADGLPVANFSMATTRGRKDAQGNWQDETEWHRIVAWEYLAELASGSLFKGSKCFVKGRIQTRKYTDKQGIERTSFDIVAQEIVLLDKKGEGGGAPAGEGDWADEVPF